MAIRPLHDRLLIKQVNSETTTKSGIIIPETAKEKPQEGEIIAAGPGKMMNSGSLREMSVKVGDKVLFAKYAETTVTVDGEDYLLLREDDILAVYT